MWRFCQNNLAQNALLAENTLANSNLPAVEQWIKYLQVMQQSDKNEEVTVDLTFWRGKKRGINAKTHIRGT